MPHGGPHYKIVGTSDPYDGMVVKIGQVFYTSAGGGFEGNSTGRIWDRTQPYTTPSRIGPAVVPPRGFTGQIERGYGLYPQMQQEINPLQVPPVLGNALQSMRQWRNRYINPIESPMRQVVEGF